MQNGSCKKTYPKRKSNSGYMVDRKLLPRVSEYLDSKQSKAIGVDDITTYLQKTYPEYGRKKRLILNQAVIKALSTLSSSNKSPNIDNIERRYLRKRQKNSGEEIVSREDLSPSDDSDFSMNDEPLVEYKDTNAVNTSMQHLYRNMQQSPASNNTTKNNATQTKPSEVNGITDPSEDRREGQAHGTWTLDRTPTLFNVKKEPEHFTENITPNANVQNITNKNINPQSDLISEEFSNLTRNNNVVPIPKQPRIARISEDEKSNASRPGTPVNRSSTRSSKKRSEGTKEKPKKFESTISSTTFADVGGYGAAIEEISKLLFHLKHPEIFKALGIKPPRGFLLHGAPGCGKTLMANAIAGELKIPFFKIASTEVVSGISGETEQKIRSLFAEAIACAPSILFLDEIDSITPKRENAGKEMERRIVTQILTCMDELSALDANVLVIGATNRADALDPALRRAGRFDREIAMGIPDRNARKQILQVLCRGMRLSENFDYELIAIKTPGFVGADLQALIREAAMCAVNSIFVSLRELDKVSKNLFVATPTTSIKQEETQESTRALAPSWLSDKLPITDEHLNTICIKVDDFERALPHVQPSSKREGFATVPDVTWQDIGALEDIREELSMAIMAPVQNPVEFELLGLSTPPGILLAGPPGCGKTLLAKAVANEAGINFISVKGPELLNMYVGESERAVRQVFERARNSSPCVIFFDEIDALCPRRSETGDSSASSRVVNQLLTEMDGLQARKQVFIMGATNRPDILDPAILRPGRLDKLLYVGFPNIDDRIKILNAITKNGSKPCLSADISINNIASDERCEGFSGADLGALVREASVDALKDYMTRRPPLSNSIEPENAPSKTILVQKQHFQKAFDKIKPSVSGKDRLWYQAMKERHSVKV